MRIFWSSSPSLGSQSEGLSQQAVQGESGMWRSDIDDVIIHGNERRRTDAGANPQLLQSGGLR